MQPAVPPNLLRNLDEVLPRIRQSDLGLVLDFDGTIAELVRSPDDAKIHPAIVEPLHSLSRKLKLTTVMSGRAAKDIHRRVGLKGVTYVGNHGAEYITDEHLTTVPEAGQPPARIAEVFEYMKPLADGPGLVWENKGFSAAVHYRMAPDQAEAHRRLEEAVRTAPGVDGLEVFWGNMVLELRARVGVNKGYAIRKLVGDWGLSSIIFLGDDTTDGDALLALKGLRNGGEFDGLGIAVVQDGTPAVVLENADYSLDGVPEVAEFLRWLDSLNSKLGIVN